MTAPNPSIQAALAAFLIADRERLAEAAGREYSAQDSQAVALRCGPEATRLALVVRGEMLAHEASALEAEGAIRRAQGAA
ncbi:MAG TPA: hypothetical protein PKJ45_00075 [Rubrivivax sp.]|nr:hypothetical protein [Rubrivivax sp.]